ncbi:MAG TPA: hypothetical protein VMF32_21430 [Xanthobacteraceae bacterium]|nr:hypothetical protein [Xanthobacteraceae bacterium]
MKVSFSLSDEVAKRLEKSAKTVADGNASLLADLALSRLLDLPQAELNKLVARRRMDRLATSRDGWNRAFWLVLSEEMGREDAIDNPYVPRNYGAFYVVLLLNHVDRYDDEGDPFCPYVGPRTVTPESPAPFQWTFERSTSPVHAAETVAAKLRSLAATAHA